MTEITPNDATQRQIDAANPARSTWLTANAGSGKTRVLTDRVARLLLEGTRPERILCLTYTKAAASEMQNRLLTRLGEWAMLPDDVLHKALLDLGVSDKPDLASARRLFALAIETPGGLKVQTIHSFCATLLRRFPLEAGVTHGFTELDDRSAILLRSEILGDMAEENIQEIRDITAIHSGDRLDSFLASLTHRSWSEYEEMDLRQAVGLPKELTPDNVLAEVFTGSEPRMMKDLIPLLENSGTNDKALADRLRQVDWDKPDFAGMVILESALLYKASAKSPFGPKINNIPTKGLREGSCAPFMAELNDLMERVAHARTRRIALEFITRSAALIRFGRAFSQRYQARKTAAGWLDFDDLITRAGRLLSDAAMAQWVLFRLDGGIDHILVDEAQDTSPEQWHVIQHLTAEFTAGETDRLRTLFVVGDPKQSIYSFQGANIAVFDDRRKKFSADFRAVNQPMQELDLEFSFRSSPAILTAVDATFAGESGKGLGQNSHHRAFLSTRPGRIDLWPEIKEPEKPVESPWDEPVDQLSPDAVPTRLAAEIAQRIKDMTDPDIGVSITTRGGERQLTAGDILILVQTRTSPLFGEIIRALKAADLPVAGADRLKLAAELAVKDIRAMLNFLATPEDDLSLASLLRSPLIGLDEDALFRLAHNRTRGEYLWQRLRISEHTEARMLLSDMIDHSNLRPFDLISRLLGRHGGREKLLARLGPEAEDGIEELLTQSLAYERTEIPSLTGFLVWLSADDVEVRRQPGSGAGLIRIMTVHGSKGLESPVVILPETKKRRSKGPPQLLWPKDSPPVLSGHNDQRPEFVQSVVDEDAQLTVEERKRLLYVAMTRAESWLIVAADGDPGCGDESWYAMIRDGLTSSGLKTEFFETGIGLASRYSYGEWPGTSPVSPPPATENRPSDTTWLWVDPPEAQKAKPALSASALGGAKALYGPDGDNPEAAMLFGTRLHVLLEQLPAIPRDDWLSYSYDILAGAEGGLPDQTTILRLLDEVTAILDAPELSTVFSPPPDAEVLAEVDLSINLPGLGLLHGVIDRLIVTPDVISVIDYKTNATVPTVPEQTPMGILRQMAAYRTGLKIIYPDRTIVTAIIWTTTRSLMWLPDDVLDHAFATLDPVRQAT